MQGITVRSRELEIEIFNIYIPNVAVCRSGYSPSLDILLEGQNRIILGNLNAHHDRKCCAALNRQFIEHPGKPDRNR